MCNGWESEDTDVDVSDEDSFFLAVLSQIRTKDLILSF